MLLMLSSIILAIVVACFIVMAEGVAPLMGARNRARRFWLLRGSDTVWISAIAIGATAGVVNYITPKLTSAMLWLAPVMLAVLVVAIVALVLYWHRRGCNRLPHILPFVVLAILAIAPMKALAARTVGCVEFATKATPSPLAVSLIMAIPAVVAIVAIGLMFTSMFAFWYTDGRGRQWRIAAIVAGILTVAIIAGIVIPPVASAVQETRALAAASTSKTVQAVEDKATKAAAEAEAKAEAKTAEEATEENVENTTTTQSEDNIQVGFYNLSMLKDNESSNDYYFGFDPLELDSVEALMNGRGLSRLSTAEKEQLTIIVRDELFHRMSHDTALLAAIAAWTDVNYGTSYIGVYFDQFDSDWKLAMNAAATRWANNPEEFAATAKAVEAFLRDSSAWVETQTDAKDMMYMNPHTASGIPEIVVFDADQKEGTFLVFTKDIKGTKIRMALRLECGYQPANVAELMKITPEPNPVKTSSTPTSNTGTPKKSTPSSSSTPSSNKPKPSPSPSPSPSPKPSPSPSPSPTPVTPKKKNPSQTPAEVGTNDNKGWADTNDGVGAQYSKVEPASGSAKKTDQQVAQDTANNKAANEQSKAGGTNNTPSTPTPANTQVSNNANKGTGNGGIDKSTTTKSQQASTSNGSSATSGAGAGGNASEKADGSWGGPPD